MSRRYLSAVAVAAALVLTLGCTAAGSGTTGGGAGATDAASSETATASETAATTDTAAATDASGPSDAAVTDSAAGAETLTDASKDIAVVPDAVADVAAEVGPDAAPSDLPPDAKTELPPTGCTCADVTCGPGAVCVPKAGECKKNAELKAGQCWADANCPAGVPCTGAFVCPCNADCDAADTPGVCGTQPACSCATVKCGAGSVCVPLAGGCKSNADLKPGQCWTDANCAVGVPCNAVSVCPCNAMCDAPDKPGVCGNPPACNCNGNKCTADQVCLPEPNVCVSPLKAGQCWADKDCAKGQACQGAFVCPCNGKCPMLTTPGSCGGAAPVCTCEGKGCDPGQVCVADKKVCVDTNNLPAGACWTDAQCPVGAKCEGANICPCGAACFAADKPGKCDAPPQVACKCGGKPCGTGQVCAGDGVCKSSGELKPGQCWNSSNCGPGQTCDGANICPCGAMCLVADKPGTCSGGGGGGPVCQKVDPNSFGMCEMVVGVVFDGNKCVFASGCGCADKCALIFKDMTSCQLACGIM